MVVKLTKEQANYLKTFGTDKMLDAVINGYEAVVPKFKFYNFSNKTGFAPLYYAGEEELTSDKEFAKEVEEDSEEYVALKLLGFIKEKV